MKEISYDLTTLKYIDGLLVKTGGYGFYITEETLIKYLSAEGKELKEKGFEKEILSNERISWHKFDDYGQEIEYIFEFKEIIKER